jgi:hypothetical protein
MQKGSWYPKHGRIILLGNYVKTWTKTHISRPSGHQVNEEEHVATTKLIRKTTGGHQVVVGEHLATTIWSEECEVQPKAH